MITRLCAKGSKVFPQRGSFRFKISLVFVLLTLSLVVAHRILLSNFADQFRKLAGQSVSADFTEIMIRETLRYSSISLVVMVIGTLCIGLTLYAFLTNQFRSMTESVQRFQDGIYAERIPIVSNDDIGRLALAFNEMAETIEHNIRELENTDALRRELVTHISHDLRTPLTTAQGYIETILIKDESLTVQQRSEFLNIAMKSLGSLEVLVNDLFDLSKLDSAHRTLAPESFSLLELSYDVVQKFMPRAQERNVCLEVVSSENPSMVFGDISLLERALSNLIENALAFTSGGERVTVAVESNDSEVKLRVTDTGSGIRAEDLPRVFEEFYRVENKIRKRTHGSGLGLAIVKKIVDAHNGQISLRSKIGSGTTVEITLGAE